VTLNDIWTDSFVSDLEDQEIKEFQDIVISDLKNSEISNFEKDILRNNLDLWLYSLRCLRRDIEFQLSSNRLKHKQALDSFEHSSDSTSEDLKSLTKKYERWRTGASKFLVSIERRTLYVKLLLSEEKD
jgi:hypothetical protein